MSPIDRRTLVGASLALATPLALPRRLAAQEDPGGPPHAGYPAVDPTRVYDVVRFAHFDLERVESLVKASPSLANAAVDWGFGDWECTIGAAAHMGRTDIAEVLLAHGARPDLFTHAMLGNLAVVRATIEARPGIQRELGPHGFSLLHHARAGGDGAAKVVEYLEELGDADPTAGTEPLARDTADYVGDYTWGKGSADRVTVAESDGSLTLGYGEGFARTLFHLGDDVFYPTGARHVRIRFRFGDESTEISIHDPDLILRATKTTS